MGEDQVGAQPTPEQVGAHSEEQFFAELDAKVREACEKFGITRCAKMLGILVANLSLHTKDPPQSRRSFTVMVDEYAASIAAGRAKQGAPT